MTNASSRNQNNAASAQAHSLSNHTCRSPLRRDPNTIFRGNSLTSKCIDETMKLAGMHYLQVTLKPIIDEVRHSGLIKLKWLSRAWVFPVTLRLSTDLHRTQTLWNRPGQAQRVREPGDKQGKRRLFDSLMVCVCVCGQWAKWGSASGEPASLRGPHLQCHHYLWCPLSHRHVRHLLLFERVCCHPFPR